MQKSRRNGRRVIEERDPLYLWRNLIEYLHPLADHCEFVALEASHVASRSCKALDEATADGVEDDCEHDRDGSGLLQKCSHHESRTSDNDFTLSLDKFLRCRLDSIRCSACPVVLDFKVAIFCPP